MERGRGRVPYDDRGDRYMRSRSQEGRWARERDERERNDRHPDTDVRRDLHIDRDRGDLFRPKMAAQESAAQAKDVSPLHVTPSAPAFEPAPNRAPAPAPGTGLGAGGEVQAQTQTQTPTQTQTQTQTQAAPSIVTAKPPPTAPRAFGERPVSAGQASTAPASVAPEIPLPPTGPSKIGAPHDSPPIGTPVGPRLQQQPKVTRPSSKQWINPSLKKPPPPPESPKVARSQSFAQQRPIPLQRDTSQVEPSEPRRPRSSDAKSDSYSGLDSRLRAHHSEEPGEIITRTEDEKPSDIDAKAEAENPETERMESVDYEPPESMDLEVKPLDNSEQLAVPSTTSPKQETLHKQDSPSKAQENETTEDTKPSAEAATEQKQRRLKVRAVRFALPPKKTAQEEPTESDDEDMGDYFDMEINKTEAELNKLQRPKTPVEVIRRFMGLSHGAMVQILNEGEGLSDMLGDLPENHEPESEKMEVEPAIQTEEAPAIPEEPLPSKETEGIDHEKEPANDQLNDQLEKETVEEDKEKPEIAAATQEAEDLQPKAEEMDIDNEPTVPPPEPKDVPEPVAEITIDESTMKEVKEVETEPINEQAPAPIEEATSPAKPAEVEPKAPSTPSQIPDEDDETETEDEAYMEAQAVAAAEAVRRYMSTPPIDSLPDFQGPVWYQDKEFLATLDSDPIIDDFVAEHLAKIHFDRSTEQRHAQQIYADNYMQYLKYTLSDDPVATKSRDKFSVSAPCETTGTVTPEHKPEGRGTGRRFATERDLERVLQASMREDEERKERELRIQQEKYRSDKEAVIPDMYWDDLEKQQVQYIDRSGYTPLDRLVSAWHILPPSNNFTAEEAQLFEKRYLELPKQWGKIAEFLPNRDFHSCIQYYYLMKGELNLKEKLKKQPKRRKKGGRGKQRSSALVSELGNGEPEAEETPQENGENGERRRPRRAAAPTWGFEQPTTDGESTPAATPGRRGASAAAKGDQPEKVDGRKRRKPRDKDKDKDKDKEKDKDAKASKPNQVLAAAPGPSSGTGKGRGRAEARPVAAEFLPAPHPLSDPHRLPVQFEQPLPAGIQPPFVVPQPQLMDRPKPAVTSINEVMAAPSLRPEPPPPPPSSITTFNLQQPIPERKAMSQAASSYWSVSEANDFPHLLRAFGTDWSAIAKYMQSKTTVMVCAPPKNFCER